mmetsp:Transcript_87982/g.152435  ORF Transcript_87982/g.152435 Transcript_87982/m.152435 type:complete len:280 (-) Transcript_87982:27-866(-)
MAQDACLHWKQFPLLKVCSSCGAMASPENGPEASVALEVPSKNAQEAAAEAGEITTKQASEIPTKAEQEEAVSLREDGPTTYRCMQGVLFCKRSEDPKSRRIVKLHKPVGTFIYSTGYIWTGPGGGVWCEMDARKGEMGWMLVKGPGFGLGGPALVDLESLQKTGVVSVSVILLIESGEPGIIFSAFVASNITTKQLKKMISEKTGFSQQLMALSKDLPGKNPATGETLTCDYMKELKDNETMASAGFPSGGTAQLFCVYLGDWPQSFKFPPPLTSAKK